MLHRLEFSLQLGLSCLKMVNLIVFFVSDPRSKCFGILLLEMTRDCRFCIAVDNKFPTPSDLDDCVETDSSILLPRHQIDIPKQRRIRLALERLLERSGVNRGAERIVKGSDGSTQYTGDHYRTFTKF